MLATRFSLLANSFTPATQGRKGKGYEFRLSSFLFIPIRSRGPRLGIAGRLPRTTIHPVGSGMLNSSSLPPRIASVEYTGDIDRPIWRLHPRRSPAVCSSLPPSCSCLGAFLATYTLVNSIVFRSQRPFTWPRFMTDALDHVTDVFSPRGYVKQTQFHARC